MGHKSVFKLNKCEKVGRNFVNVLIMKFCEIQFRRAHFNSVSNFSNCNFLLGATAKHLTHEFFYVDKSVNFCLPKKIRH